MNTASAPRRVALDWLRIAAFGLLIFYHVGMFYVTWDWHVKSSRASGAIEPLMLAVNPWRLLLLFVISGVATRYMADKMKAGPLLASRTWRLLPPLVFAIFVIVPPQTYLEIVEQIGYAGSFWDFYPAYATASGNWCDADGCLITPTYNHMWFVAYLFVYSVVLIALLPLVRRAPKALAALVQGPWLILAPWLYLAVMRAALAPVFGQTHAMVDDWYLHAIYFAGFVFGFGVAKLDAFFEACAKQRWLALALASAAYATLMWARATYDFGGATPPAWGPLAAVGLRELQAWCAIVALIGFAHRHWRADGPVRRYLTDAIFPFYLIHQTAIVASGYYLDKLGWPVWAEAATVIAITAAACLLAYEIARRTPILRPFFGLKSPPRAQQAPGKSIETPPPAGHIKNEA